jgi:hypothetical protein
MSDLKKAAQQALAYMESIGQQDMYPEEWAIAEDLRAALEQPEQEPRSRWQWMCRVLICLGTGNTSATRRAIVRAAAIGRSMK